MWNELKRRINRTTLKDIKKYNDLYDNESTILYLNKLFEYVSCCNKSIPSISSICRMTKNMNTKYIKEVKIENIVIHHNDTITLKQTRTEI